MIRTGETRKIPLRAETIPLITFKNGRVIEAQSDTGKIALLKQCSDTDTIIAVWPGLWHTDTFIVDRAIALEMLEKKLAGDKDGRAKL